jgi:hypothetical protein
MAYRVAKAVACWHEVDWVHQGISAHNVFFFKRKSEERWSFTSPMLQGFDFSRPNTKPSLEPYVQSLEADVYRHPDRQGPSCDGHRKVHDLYSLGVVLLEIGIWSTGFSLVTTVLKNQDIKTTDMVRCLKEIARTRLAHSVGTQYQEAVMTCLESDFGVSEDEKRENRLFNAMDKLVLQKLAKNYGR